MNTLLRAAFVTEMKLAKHYIATGSLDAGFRHIERAHILGQAFVIPHARTHWLMFRVAVLRRRPVEAFGQIVRLILGTLGSAIGIVPAGNPGGSHISMFKRMPVDSDLLDIIQGRTNSTADS